MKRRAPATARNSEPLYEVLERELPEKGLVLEIASGSGEHALFFALRFPALEWQPSDASPEALASIAAWREESGLANVHSPVTLDACSGVWPVGSADVVLCINMIHIAPWKATEGLFAGAARALASGAPLILYGPFFDAGLDTAASNRVFDANLKSRNPEWGLRDIAAVDRAAQGHGFVRTARYTMPANNLALVYRKA